MSAVDLSKLLVKFSAIGAKNTVNVIKCSSPLGKLISAADEQFIYMICIEDSDKLEKKLSLISKELNCLFVENKNTLLTKLQSELDDYFNGSLIEFTVPIKMTGSEFQKEVWKNLRELPYAGTKSYGDMAKTMGKPKHARAVGAACGANAHLIVVPCHRVVAGNSKGGFSSGLHRKEWLLDLESKYSN